MLSVSNKFLAALRTSGKRKTIIDVTESFGAVNIFSQVPIIDGSLTVDRNSDVRRSGWIKVGEKSLTDVFFTNHAGPFGMEIKLYHGIVFPDGSEELVPMGVFCIENFDWQEGDGGWPVIQLYDRSKWIHRAPFISPQDFSGKFVQTVLSNVVAEAVPSATVQFQVGLNNPRLPGGSVFEGSRWDVVQKCAESMAAEAYFDADGILQVTEVADPTATESAATWEFNVGEGFSEIQGEEGSATRVSRPAGNLVSAKRSVTREATFNGVVVYGSAPNATTGQPYALAYDNDPDSPTYFFGPFGKAIDRIDNQLLTSEAQCSDAAAAALKNRLGLVRSLDFVALGNPALEEGDYNLFTFSDGSQEVHLLDSYTYPLGPGEFTATTRTNPSRQTTAVGVEKGSSRVDVKPNPPGTPEILGVTSTSVTLSWPVPAPGTAAIASYELYFNSSLKKEVPHPQPVQTVVTGLSPGTTYRINVRAVDTAGLESNLGGSVQVKTSGISGGGGGGTGTTYTKTYVANWSRSYTGGNDPATWHGNDVYQGTVSGGNGNMRSLIGFNDQKIRSDTSGADILECHVYLYFKHWWSNAGGTAIIGTHNYDDRPGSWSNGNVYQDRVRSSGWPKPGGRWVNLGATIGNAFRTGSAKGIAIGPAPSGSTTYYGVARGASSGSLTPVLRIKYRK